MSDRSEPGGSRPLIEVDEAEVVVVGAGPAGSACAAELAELGHDVLLADQSQFPRDKPCGDGVTRSAVESLRRLGLDDLLRASYPVRGVRVLEDYVAREERRYASGEARCITRAKLDHALLGAATDRGARRRTARVDRVHEESGSARGVIIANGSEDQLIRARWVVAADGATSRLRRNAFGQPGAEPRAYAVRIYGRVDKPPDPVYEIFVPLELETQTLIGYGWVFPIEDQLVNVGVGYIRAAGLEAPPPIRRVLEQFLRELREQCQDRYGSLETVGKPFGSPVSINFRRGRCELDGLVFIGDAARMTDPLTGEGIAYALHGGELVARELHRRLLRSDRAGSQQAGGDSLGRQLGRRFPRLGQDIGLPSRMAARTLDDGGNGADRKRPSIDGERYLEAVKRLVGSPDEEPTISDTIAWTACAAHSPSAAGLLEQVNLSLLDELRTDFPFATELLHREVRARGGPVTAAAMLLSYLACGGDAELFAVRAAVAAELVSLFPMLAGSVSDEPRDKIARLNNSLAVITLDVVASRALRAMDGAARELTSEFTLSTCRMCEGLALEFGDRFDTARSVESYLETARETTGAITEFACRGGAQLAGASPEQRDALAVFGLELGSFTHLAQDLVELLRSSAATGRGAGQQLRDGTYSLAVIVAAELDPGLRAELGDALTDQQVGYMIERVRELGGDVRALAACVQSADTARELVNTCGGDTTGLRELVDRQLSETRWVTSEPSTTVATTQTLQSLPV